ncbi:hypothetical protein GCM10025760_03600 [Microbacterium yannicii]|uniref:ANTAR domain-containing protein n=1 Tax=Microbacterium yannicii TaxID=671622 RepID=A0ABP9LZ25_9MICO
MYGGSAATSGRTRTGISGASVTVPSLRARLDAATLAFELVLSVAQSQRELDEIATVIADHIIRDA